MKEEAEAVEFQIEESLNKFAETLCSSSVSAGGNESVQLPPTPKEETGSEHGCALRLVGNKQYKSIISNIS